MAEQIVRHAELNALDLVGEARDQARTAAVPQDITVFALRPGPGQQAADRSVVSVPCHRATPARHARS